MKVPLPQPPWYVPPKATVSRDTTWIVLSRNTQAAPKGEAQPANKEKD